MNFFAMPYTCRGNSIFLFLCIYVAYLLLTPYYFFGKVRIPKRMGFVAFGLCPSSVYNFTLIFDLLENYMADCRHFQCELSLWEEEF